MYQPTDPFQSLQVYEHTPCVNTWGHKHNTAVYLVLVHKLHQSSVALLSGSLDGPVVTIIPPQNGQILLNRNNPCNNLTRSKK